MSNFEKVGKFMKTFGQEVEIKASFPEEKIVKLRYDLIAEELEEFNEYSEVCFAYAFALLGSYLWASSEQDRFN